MLKLTQITRDNIINLLKEVPELGNGSEGGAPSKLTPRSKRLIASYVNSQTARTPRQAASILEDSVGVRVSAQAVRNVSKEAGLESRKKAKKPLMSDRHKRNRLKFALKHKEWNIED